METAPCPDCNFEIELLNPRQGQRLACPNCGADLEVINRRPLELDLTYAEPDDDLDILGLDEDEWDDDWENDEMNRVEEHDEDWED